jgi:hypothetical protein
MTVPWVVTQRGYWCSKGVTGVHRYSNSGNIRSKCGKIQKTIRQVFLPFSEDRVQLRIL